MTGDRSLPCVTPSSWASIGSTPPRHTAWGTRRNWWGASSGSSPRSSGLWYSPSAVWYATPPTPSQNRVATCGRSRSAASARRRSNGCESRIDLYQFHWPDDTGTPIEYSWQEMIRLLDEGKVRGVGVCNFDVGSLAICGQHRHVDSLQAPFSLIRRETALVEIPWCAERGTAVLSYSPMQSGLLSGAFSAARMKRLGRDDWRRTSPEFQPPRLGRNLALAHGLRPIARRHGVKGPACPEDVETWQWEVGVQE